MSVYRRHKSKDFSVINNCVFKDKNLSLKAKGLLTTILSLPEDWKYSIEGLASLSSDGTTSVTSAINELIEAGYIVRSQSNDKQGRFDGYVYDIYETPQEPFTENPITDNSFTENDELLRTNILNTNISNTKELDISPISPTEKSKRFVPPTVEEVAEYCKKRNCDIDPVAFVAYYASQNWKKANGRPVSDWKLCVITWEKKEARRHDPTKKSRNPFDELLTEEGYS